MGTHSLEAAQEYFDSVGFEISRDAWEKMGAKFPIQKPEYEDEEAPDDQHNQNQDECELCGESLSKLDTSGYHECHPEFKS
jgi:hypothetical protein